MPVAFSGVDILRPRDTINLPKIYATSASRNDMKKMVSVVDAVSRARDGDSLGDDGQSAFGRGGELDNRPRENVVLQGIRLKGRVDDPCGRVVCEKHETRAVRGPEMTQARPGGGGIGHSACTRNRWHLPTRL